MSNIKSRFYERKFRELYADININPFSTGTGWTLYKVYGGFRISYGTGPSFVYVSRLLLQTFREICSAKYNPIEIDIV